MPGRYFKTDVNLPVPDFQGDRIDARGDRPMEIRYNDLFILTDQIIVACIHKGERHDSKINQIGLMNPGKTLYKLDLHPEEPGGQGGVLP